MTKSRLTEADILNIDQQHIWHPYASYSSDQPLFCVKSANGVYLHLDNGKSLIDGMSSWWSVIHGYNHPRLNQAVIQQTEAMSHVMFGGLTHEPAARLAKKLVDITPKGLDQVFFCDSGSVAVEVAMKMAIQFWQSNQQAEKNRFLSLRNGYHGDTFAAMSVCDPVTGMHHLFKDTLTQQYFTESPRCRFDEIWSDDFFIDFKKQLQKNHKSIAAVILEPIVQGTGGMRFYAPEFLRQVRKACDQYNVLLIADEIATGFGRTGTLFACEHADISPDILCLGKALTGGYMTLAATLCSNAVAEGICQGEAGVFMHGPTFMANPLACAVACASLELLEENHWQTLVKNIEAQLKNELTACENLTSVATVRALGAIGVIEMNDPVDLRVIQPKLVERGIWLRPFGKLVYMMPPYISSEQEINTLISETYNVLKHMF